MLSVATAREACEAGETCLNATGAEYSPKKNLQKSSKKA
jgi:hypothetical protein